ESSLTLITLTINLKASTHAYFFFFQAEDGIRYRNVTGVQTCALPISHCRVSNTLVTKFAVTIFVMQEISGASLRTAATNPGVCCIRSFPSNAAKRKGPELARLSLRQRSEERRVGKGCSCETRRWP